VLGLDFGRIQFTSDLLPTDIVGVSVVDLVAGSLTFRPGPVFHQVVLADEINRATPRTQSALLEAMAEGQVSVEGRTHPLPAPFFVIATQNPVEHYGTFPLPESQLDRFMMTLRMGYPGRDAERSLLTDLDTRVQLERAAAVIEPRELAELQDLAGGVAVAPAATTGACATTSRGTASPTSSGRAGCGCGAGCSGTSRDSSASRTPC